MTSHVMKHSENIFPPVVPVLKSKTRILSTVTNQDARLHDLSCNKSKAALERQRENASKLASGRSVVSKADKENEGAFKKPLKAVPKAVQKPKKPLESKKPVLKKSDSIISIYNQETVKAKEKVTTTTSTIPKPEVIIPRIRKVSVNKEEPKLRPITNTVKEKEEERVEKIEPEKEEKEEDIPLGVNIIDSDEDTHNSEFILGLYAKDIYNFLRYLEETQSIRKNYLTSAHIMTQQMRTVLVDWIFEVQQSFRLLNETVQLAIALLDRFMQDHPGIVKDELQLVAVACIFLASKYEEMYPPDLEDLVDISAKTYTKGQILKMEQVIFSALDFQMGRPLPSQFLRRYGRAGSVDFVTYCFSKYFIDLSLVNYSLCHIRPSLLAAACLYLSLYLSADESNTDFWTPTLVYYSQYSAETLKPIVSKIASIVLEVPTSKFQTVPNKYLDPKRLHNVSARSELKSEKLKKIAKENETYL
ncbi:UNVERIFIED_CONTAM: hypothetical protein PYX00_002935 [Menopon gallinae]|uniref:Uncharacterized protein n=1 Tax=Menopon gallinae TaxID=328185 RepID=A0AAW2HYQ5_9NEOP